MQGHNCTLLEVDCFSFPTPAIQSVVDVGQVYV